jgi:acetyl esterase
MATRPVVATPPLHCEVYDEHLAPTPTTGPLGIWVRHYLPPAPLQPRSTFVFMHGGGWVLGDVDLSDGFCRELAIRGQTHVVSVGYRLAPENPYPAALDDTVSVITEFGEQRIETSGLPLIVGGISAGANLAAAAAIRRRDECARIPDLQVLICPVLDIEGATDSYRQMAEGNYLTAADMRWFWQQYTGESEPTDDGTGWRSPCHVTDLSGIPPALIVNAEFDVLRDEGQAYADRLAAAGIEAVSVTFAGMIHGFVSDRRLAPARAAMQLIVRTVQDLEHITGGTR